MFAGIRDFLYRHRRKFLAVGVVIGGAALLKQYAEHRLVEWHDRETRKLLEKQKRRQHFENTQRTANATVLSLSSSIREVLLRELDADALLQAIREQPQHKREIWEQLKVVGISRVVGVVYVSALLVPVVHVQLFLLGGYTFADTIQEAHAGVPINQTIQQKYLSSIQHLIETGLPRLLNQITKAVAKVSGGLPLNHPLTLTQLEGVLHQVRLYLMGEDQSGRSLQDGVECISSSPHTLGTWSSYALGAPVPPDGEDEVSRILYNMLMETSDIIDSDDFSSTVDTLLQIGFNHILDKVAEFYPAPNLPTIVPADTTSSASKEQKDKENWVDSIVRENSSTGSEEIQPQSAGTASSTPPSPQQETNNNRDTVQQIQQEMSPSVATSSGSSLHQSVMPVAKLVPILSGLLHVSLSPVPGHLLHTLLTNDRLQTIGANVYEAFATPVL